MLTKAVNGGASGGGDVSTDAIWDAEGDLLVGTGANTGGRLAKGAANQVLTMKADASTPEWKDASGGSVAELTPEPVSDHSFSGPSATMTAGEALDFGQLCYLKSDGKWWKADADAATSMPGLAIAGATIAADATGVFILPGSFIRDDSWNWTVGALIYAGSGATTSHAAGAINQGVPTGAGDQIQAIGIATHADRMLFVPSISLVERG